VTLTLSIAGAVLPSLALLRYFYKRDLNPEPRGVLLRTFLLGVLIALPVAMVTSQLWQPGSDTLSPLLAGFYGAFLCAAIPEELFKFLVVARYCARHPAFDEPMDGVVYGATASLGFATLENVLYVARGGWSVAIARAVTAVPCHACLGAILGYHIAQARFGPEGRTSMWTGLVTVILIHGLYDLPLMTVHTLGSEATDWQKGLAGGLVTAVLVATILWTRRIVRKLRREQLQLAAAGETAT
jgi:RsiW-degrading membrane proteinase PrsW (M82 family)